jgi:hypothetical protein
MRRLIALLVLAVTTAATACGGDSSTNPNAAIGGTYTLKTVNGSPLPYILVQSGTSKFEITDDVVVLTDAGTWTESGHTRTTENGVVTTDAFVDGGSYSRSGTAITLVSSASGSISGSVANGTLTISDVGLVAVYQR